jgi:hypothetical protein
VSGSRRASSFRYLDSPRELKDNSNYIKWLNYFSNGNTLELYGRMYAEFFKSDVILINVVNMNIKLHVHQNLFIFFPFQMTTKCYQDLVANF